MRISTGKSRQDTNWQVKNVSWDTLCRKLSEPVRTKETVAEYHAMNKDDKAKAKDVGGFVGGALSGGRRTKSNIVSRSLVTLDADFADADSWERAELLLDYTMCCYSTHSHTPKSPRLRYIIPLDREVSPEEYEPIARQLAGDIGIEQFDVTTYETSRLMYWPSVPSDGEYVYEVSGGELVSADEVLSRYDDWHDTASWPIGPTEQKVRAKQAKAQGDPESKPGMVGLFCRTYDVPSAIEAFLPGVYEDCGNGRYTYTEGSTSAGAVLYDNGKFLYSHHSTDPAGGVLCNAFDLVRLHKFGDLDDPGKEVRVNLLPSYKAMCEFIRDDTPLKEQLIGESLEAFAEPVDEEPQLDWTEQLTVDKHGAVEPTIDNVFVILENDSRLSGRIALNEFTQRACVIADLPWKKCADKINGSMWDDMDDSNLRRYIEKVYHISNKDKVNDALNVAMQRHAFHPVRDYLQSLEWDGECRVDDLFINYFGAEDNLYTRTVTRKWLVAAVARVMQPGVKFDNMIVLIGDQGIGKSYFGKLLGKHWFSDTFSTMSGKEAYEQLKGAWILEMGELSVMKKAEVESVKMFISKQEDNYRAAYGRHVTSFKRQCIFYGTTNDDTFLRDATGNRRFWPIGCDPYNSEFSVFDLTEEDIDQIWSEAVYWYKHKEPLYLSAEVAKLAEKEQAKYTAFDPRTGAIEEYLDTPVPVNWDDMSKTDRRNFIQGFLKTEGETKLRDTISVVELAYELYGLEELQPYQAKEYHSILTGLKNWRKTGKRTRSVYGRQPVYERTEQCLS